MPSPAAVVVVPALDEQRRIEACIAALAAQDLAAPYEVVLVDDGCQDATVECARAAARARGLALRVLPGPGSGPGPARQLGLDLAARRLIAAGRPDGLVATTDADTRVPASWLRDQVDLLVAGADAVAGWIELDGDEAALLPAQILAWRDGRAVERLAAVRRLDPDAEHHHFAGASIGLRARTYADLGCRLPADLEDAALADALHVAGARIVRTRAVAVLTSARMSGRARRGLSADLTGKCMTMGITDKITGRVKQATGDIAGDSETKREGDQEERKGEAKEELAETQNKADSKSEEVSDLESKT